MFGKLKDKGISKTIKVRINSKLKEYGEMLKFNLDSKNKTIEITIMLDGEKEALDVNITKYKVIEDNGEHFIQIKDFTTSRKWMNVVAKEFINNKKVKLPKEYVSIINLLI